MELVTDSAGVVTVHETDTFLTVIERSGSNGVEGLATIAFSQDGPPVWDVPLTMKELILRNMKDHGYNQQTVSSNPPASSTEYYDIEIDNTGNQYFISYPNLPYPTCASFQNNSPVAIASRPAGLTTGDIFRDKCNNLGIFKDV